MGVPDNISISWEGPDNQGWIRAFATSKGNELGAATALPDNQAPGGWVISDMRFRDDEHWPSLGQVLLDRLVAQSSRSPRSELAPPSPRRSTTFAFARP